MQSKVSILAFLSLVASAAAVDIPVTYFPDHKCAASVFKEVDLVKVGKCYNLAFAARSFEVDSLRKGCEVAAYKKASCAGNADFEIISDVGCIQSDGVRTGDFINSLKLVCGK